VDIHVGPWKYDAAARARPPLAVFSELAALYASLQGLLLFGLKKARALCGETLTGGDAAALLTSRLVAAALDPDKPLPREARREALALVCDVLKTLSSSSSAAAAASADGFIPLEASALQATRSAACHTLSEHVIPRLEALVRVDYPGWREAGWSGDAAASSEQVGAEKVETLARCYAYLLESGHMQWSVLEARLARPFSFTLFWRQANAAYRQFTAFALAHAIHHAPGALCRTPGAHAAVARVWLLSLFDPGRRQCAWYLTRMLVADEATEELFHGVTEAQVGAGSLSVFFWEGWPLSMCMFRRTILPLPPGCSWTSDATLEQL
jgi:hypothetical protein